MKTAYALAVVRDGALLGWKCNTTGVSIEMLANRYYGPYSPLDPHVVVEVNAFDGDDAMDQAADWCAGFLPMHPDAQPQSPPTKRGER